MRTLLFFLLITNFLLAQNSKIEFLSSEKKYGVSKDKKLIIPAKYDSITIKDNFYIGYLRNHCDLYDKSGNQLYHDLHTVQFLDNFFFNNVQIIDLSGNTYFIDSVGNKLNPDEIKSNFTRTPLLDEELSYNAVETYEIKSPFQISFSLLDTKKIKNKDIESHKIISPENSNFIKFLLTNDTSISFPKDYKCYLIAYMSCIFNQYQVLVEKNKKFGIWNLKTKKFELPAHYEDIQVFDQNLILKRNDLYTFFPNIGKKTKYKKLEPYIEYFARFETPDGKKGWVDRKGIEYFDQ
ncbi:hypothetical protein [Chryseobacterium luteum]|uniref:WG repeat-containing protein n=1 Tax=Chryseobacterium luteum TaxID=421531 RepID=A0A085ZX72_9FLAO|nr:hypothetical protein [Chryseobacterium luteum]KFF09036.1 hypothetical protein IX38_00525 [Chryseobacterium luteum]